MTMSPTSADRRTLLARFLGSATALAACRPTSSAALVVYDPANHAENLIQTAQSLYAEIQREITNQAVRFTAQANQLNLLPLDPAARAALQPNMQSIDQAIIDLRQVQQTSQGMNGLFNRLRNLATSIANGGDIDDYIQVIDEIRRTLNRDVAGVSSAFISMSSANAQLNAILAQSAVAVGAMQAQQVSHQLQSMQVREAMLQRYLQALELQRTAINQELDEARGRATEEEMRRQFQALIDAGRSRR